MWSPIHRRPKGQSEIGCMSTTVVLEIPSRKGHSSLKALHTEKSFCEKHGIKHLAMDGGSNQSKCHNQAQAPIIILYLGIPYTPPSRHQHVCLKLCPLIAAIIQVPPFFYIIRNYLRDIINNLTYHKYLLPIFVV